MTSHDPLSIPDAARELPSFTEVGGAALWLEPSGPLPFRVAAPREHPLATRVEGKTETTDAGVVRYAEQNAANAAALREALEWLTPKPLGLATSAGFGDRLGVATPGHVRAVQHFGAGITPIYAQQSIREMTRTNRSPQAVMDDATWGAFAGGWRGPVGADADHQKTTADLDRCVAAGFTFFTVDPGEHVDDSAHGAPENVIAEKVAALPWRELETTQKDFEASAGQPLELGDRTLTLAREDVLRAAANPTISIRSGMSRATFSALVPMLPVDPRMMTRFRDSEGRVADIPKIEIEDGSGEEQAVDEIQRAADSW